MLGDKYLRKGNLSKAIDFYEKIGENVKLINLYCEAGEFEKVSELCENEQNKEN